MHIDRPITIALILFIILLLVFFLVAPEYDTFKKLQTEFGQKKAEFNAEFDYYAAVARTYYDLQSRKDDVKKIDDALPSDLNLGRVIYYLQQVASENGLVVKDLFLSKLPSGSAERKTTSNIKDIALSMDLLGSYPALGNFIASLEKSSRIFEVITISFGAGNVMSSQPLQPPSGSQQPRPQQTYSFNLQIKTHSY